MALRVRGPRNLLQQRPMLAGTVDQTIDKSLDQTNLVMTTFSSAVTSGLQFWRSVGSRLASQPLALADTPSLKGLKTLWNKTGLKKLDLSYRGSILD